MNYLVIDTTKKIAHLIAQVNDKPYEITLGEDEKHSENLLPSIDKILQMASCTLDEIDCFGIVTGPGSFTGIRVGLATIKAFCFGKKKKVVALSHFDLVKDVVGSGTMLLTSTRTTYYMGQIKNKKIVQAKVVDKGNVTAPYFAYVDEKDKMPEDIVLLNNYEQLVREYMEKSIKAKNFVDISSVEPYYLQLSQAEREWEDKHHD